MKLLPGVKYQVVYADGWVPMDRPPKETITQITDSSGNPIDNMTVLVYLKQYKCESLCHKRQL